MVGSSNKVISNTAHAMYRDGSTRTQRQPTIPKNDYQRSLDSGTPIPRLTAETVRYWSDFNRVYYNPKSIIQLNDYELNSRIMPFENWQAGEELFSIVDREADILDRDLRPFAEECDQLGGIQIFTGADDAWGGFAATYVDKLRDEYGKSSIWIWATEHTQNLARSQRLRKQTNVARSINATAPYASAYIRLACPPSKVPIYANLEPSSEWHNSAVLAIAVESMTLPGRLKAIGGRRGVLSDFEAVLNVQGSQSLFELGLSINTGNEQTERRLANGNANGHKSGTSSSVSDDDFDYTPADGDIPSVGSDRVFAQVEVSRGKLYNNEASDEQLAMPEEWERRQRRIEAKPIVERFHSRIEFPIIDSFPQDVIPTRSVTDSLCVAAVLTSTSKSSDRLRVMQKSIRGVLGLEEREVLLNGLAEIEERHRDEEASDHSGDDKYDDDV